MRLTHFQLLQIEARAVPEHVEPVYAALRLNIVDELHFANVIVLAVSGHLAVRCVDRFLEPRVNRSYRPTVIERHGLWFFRCSDEPQLLLGFTVRQIHQQRVCL